jgi:outer membrane receptor for ferrienterochelin and colicin
MSMLLTVILISQQLYELDEVVVTASRYPLLLQDVAVAVMVIEREDIEKLDALNIGDALITAAGIEIKDYGTAGVTSISTRGIPSTGTLVLVNGQPSSKVRYPAFTVQMLWAEWSISSLQGLYQSRKRPWGSLPRQLHSVRLFRNGIYLYGSVCQ